MIINHNISADFAHRVNSMKNSDLNAAREKLTTGMRINRASDDAPALAVSERMRAQIRGLGKASTNIQDAMSLMNSADGYLTETNDILLRIRDLAIQSANGIYTDEDRLYVNTEINQLVNEIERVASQAAFNGKLLFTGLLDEENGTPVRFQIGANVDQAIQTAIKDMSPIALGLIEQDQQIQSLTINTAEDANLVIARVDAALTAVTEQRATLGAIQSRLTYMKEGVDTTAEYLQAAESRIRDTDMASTVSEMVQNQILSQSSLAMLVQANSSNQNVLSLLT